MSEALSQLAVVGEQHQAFALKIQTAYRMQTMEPGRDQVVDGGTALRIVAAGEIARRFVQEEIGCLG